ncbi:MAG TPA: ATP-grasp domain-containing protein [Ktedonobacterales bacterium]|nr:ATP-grasp domain-containing protein [Ktedonobacterales bacterium]
MPILLLSPRNTDDSHSLQRAAEDADWHVLRLENWRPPQRALTDEVVLYGEPLFVDVMASALDLVALDSPPDWLARLPLRFTQRAVTAMTLAEAMQLREPRFVKSAVDKPFLAGIYTMATEPPPGSADLPDDYPVLVAEPVHWTIEFRGFVLHRRLVALSPYLRNGELLEDEDGNWAASDEEWQAARAFYAQVLADTELELPPAIVLDVGYISERGWAIIETNGAWGAGLYGCNPAEALAVIRHATQPAGRLAQADQIWIRPRVEVEG